MVNYGNGKVYKIVSNQTDKVYVGSTTKKYLSQRMDGHRCHHKMWKDGKRKHKVTSFDVLQFEDAYIVLIENFPCNSKDELSARERYWIDSTENCVNKYKPGRTRTEHYQDNKCKINNKVREYYETHKQQCKTQRLAWRKANPDSRKKTKLCPCGGRFRSESRARHRRSEKHMKWWRAERVWLDSLIK